MDEREHDLGTAELEVLRAVWDDQPATVRQVLNRLHDRGRNVAYTTVQTVLTRLEQKGVVASDKRDTAYVYRAKLTRDSVGQSRLRALVDQIYDGAAAPMVLQLIENEKFSAEELSRLRRLIDDLDPRTPGA